MSQITIQDWPVLFGRLSGHIQAHARFTRWARYARPFTAAGLEGAAAGHLFRAREMAWGLSSPELAGLPSRAVPA